MLRKHEAVGSNPTRSTISPNDTTEVRLVHTARRQHAGEDFVAAYSPLVGVMMAVMRAAFALMGEIPELDTEPTAVLSGEAAGDTL